MVLPSRGAPTPTRAERQLWDERNATKEAKKKRFKDMDKLATENDELRKNLAAAKAAATNKGLLGASEVGETAENAESAEDNQDLVSGMFEFHYLNGAL